MFFKWFWNDLNMKYYGKYLRYKVLVVWDYFFGNLGYNFDWCNMNFGGDICIWVR